MLSRCDHVFTRTTRFFFFFFLWCAHRAPRLAAMQNDSALPATATTYSLTELRSLVAYAADRGVRVVPEFDMPGHGSWQYGMPELCLTSCPNVLDVYVLSRIDPLVSLPSCTL